jgi:catechol 2,3-dioxygenase-like lactoylglutathione lyase family enzyme
MTARPTQSTDGNAPRRDISRRGFVRAVAAGTAAVAMPNWSAAEPGQAGRAPRVEPTGWRTVWLDHLSYRCADYEKAAAFYVALLGWKVRSDDGTRAVLEIGDNAGDIIIQGGLSAPTPAALTDASPGATRAQAMFDGFAWGIAPWDTDAVKAALEQRGLNPVAEHEGDYKAFAFKDPDGFSVRVTNATRARRRAAPPTGLLKTPLPFAPTGWKTVFVDHLSFEVADYRRSTAFYESLLGWQVRGAPTGAAWPDSPNSFTVRIGDIAGAIIRNGRTASPNGVSATIGHISFGIEPWNADGVRAALMQRDVAYTINGQRSPRNDMAGGLESYHVPDAMGWDLQISNRIAP